MNTFLVYSDGGPWSAHKVGVIGAIDSMDEFSDLVKRHECEDDIELVSIDMIELDDIIEVNDLEMITNGEIVSVFTSGHLDSDQTLSELGWLYIVVEY